MAAQLIDKSASAVITRPSNTTQYAIGDVIAGNGITVPISFNINVSQNMNAWVLGGQCISSAKQGTLPQIDLMLFSDTFTVDADNAPFNPSTANLQSNYLGTISFNNFQGLNSNSICDAPTNSGKPIVITPNSGIIYGVAVARNTYTPVSAETFLYKLDFQPISS